MKGERETKVHAGVTPVIRALEKHLNALCLNEIEAK